MRILIITPALPYPPNNGDKIRQFNLIKRISRNCDISLVALIKHPEEKEFIPEMLKYCTTVEVALLQKKSKLEHMPGLIKNLLAGEPLENKFYYIEELKQKISRILALNKYDVIQIEHTCMASYLKEIIKSSTSKKVLVLHNIESILYRTLSRVARSPIFKVRFFINYLLLKSWEHKIAEKFDRCITMSSEDMEILHSVNPQLAISVVPNGVDIHLLKTLPSNFGNQNLLFMGSMGYAANIDAVLYFCDCIFPLVRKMCPGVKLFIVGGNPPEKVRKLNDNQNIIVTGYVKEVKEYYEKCVALVVPLRSGGGTRLKILESMAFGKPIVSTSLGCEGLNVSNRDNILIADNPQDFADSIKSLLENQELYEHIRAEARKLAENKYSWEIIASELLRIYGELIK